tara:strand:+ start:123 stop:485 length:363 start_codon:yes stop_codon:yes gene_type:complete
MKNKKGLSLIVTIAIIMILSVVVMTILFIMFKGNVDIFNRETGSILKTTSGIAVTEACDLACEANSRFSYCCVKHEIEIEVKGKLVERKYSCNHEVIGISCGINCDGVVCGEEEGIANGK